MKKKSVAQKFQDSLNKKHPLIRCEEFLGMARITKFACKCGFIVETSPKKVLAQGCSACNNVESELKSWKALSLPRLKELMRARHSEIQITGKSKQSRNVKAKCPKGHQWVVDSTALLVNLSGCPKCEHPQVRVKNNGVSLLDNGLKSIQYTYLSRKLSFTPHAQLGNRVYFYAEVFDLKKMAAIDRACKRIDKELNLGLIVGRKVIQVKDWQTRDNNQVQAVARRSNLKSLRLLAMDPGVTNYAWTVLDVKRPFEVKILASGMIDRTVTELVGDVVLQVVEFKAEVDSIINKFNPEYLIAERYMSRGMGGATIELVNVMIGVLASCWLHSPTKFKVIPAAQWKNEINKVEVSDQETTLEYMYAKSEVTVHQVDSAGIGCYGAAHWLDEKITHHVEKLVAIIPSQMNKLKSRGT